MKKILLAFACAALVAGSAAAQTYERERHDDGDRGRGGDVSRAIVGGAVRAQEGRSVDRDDDCRIVIEHHRTVDGGVVEERHRECD